MRNRFIERIVEHAETDLRIALLCGDLGYSVLERFATRFPDRFVNVGVAEQNMAGVAAGLALTGYKLFTYSIANFAITRCLEQLRNDICYNDLDVTVVAVGAGFAYGSQGYSHHGAEDVGFARALPNMSVIVPADPIEAEAAADYVVRRRGPAYVRLARGGEPALHAVAVADIAQPLLLYERGSADVVLLASGVIAQEAVAAAKILADAHVSVAAISVPVLTRDVISKLAPVVDAASVVITLEEHIPTGGLGTLVAEFRAGRSHGARIVRLGIDHVKINEVGSQSYLRAVHGLDAQSVVTTAMSELRRVAGRR